MTLARSIADIAEDILGVKIARPHRFGVRYEHIVLKRFLDGFNVDCVFDVGANVGQYATMLRQRVGYKGAIVSFEPNPNAAQSLRISASNDPNWHVEEMALDNKEGTATFNVMQQDQFSSLLLPDHTDTALFADMNAVAEQVEVRTSTLAKEFERYRARLGFRRPFLKMDTQGHDLQVARGAGEALNEFVGLQSELGIKPLYKGAPSYYETLQFYESRGFALTALVPNNEGHFPDLFETDCIMYNPSKWTGA